MGVAGGAAARRGIGDWRLKELEKNVY